MSSARSAATRAGSGRAAARRRVASTSRSPVVSRAVVRRAPAATAAATRSRTSASVRWVQPTPRQYRWPENVAHRTWVVTSEATEARPASGPREAPASTTRAISRRMAGVTSPRPATAAGTAGSCADGRIAEGASASGTSGANPTVSASRPTASSVHSVRVGRRGMGKTSSWWRADQLPLSPIFTSDATVTGGFWVVEQRLSGRRVENVLAGCSTNERGPTARRGFGGRAATVGSARGGLSRAARPTRGARLRDAVSVVEQRLSGRRVEVSRGLLDQREGPDLRDAVSVVEQRAQRACRDPRPARGTVERMTRLELATSTLGRSRSTN